jgi:ribokinase
MKQSRIVSIGSVVQDVFLRSKLFKAHREEGELVQEFVLGEKYEIEDVIYSTGGGASNAAVTFARLGLHSTFIGKVGDDPVGRIVIDELHADQVETGHVHIVKGARTGYSTILLSPNGERSILAFRGDSVNLTTDELDLTHIVPDWIYISTLGGNFAALEKILHSARALDIKVALNPGKLELEHPAKLRALLPACTLLSLNSDEMQSLVPAENVEAAMRIASELVPLVVVTDGARGALATDGRSLYKAGVYEDVAVIDRTGAGDAFSSGFTAMLASGADLTHALTYASANSTSVVQQVGSKAGILHGHSHVRTMPIAVKDLHNS